MKSFIAKQNLSILVIVLKFEILKEIHKLACFFLTKNITTGPFFMKLFWHAHHKMWMLVNISFCDETLHIRVSLTYTVFGCHVNAVKKGVFDPH
jgi:hypothetical protein